MDKPKLLIPAFNIKKGDELYKYSDPVEAQRKAFEYLGDYGQIYKSTNPKKKYMIYDIYNNKWVHFGQMNYEDYLHHKNYNRMLNYRRRATNINGEWRNNPFSPNNLSINILW